MLTPRKEEKSKHLATIDQIIWQNIAVSLSKNISYSHYLTLSILFGSIERDAQLLANRIALLKQEEMKTWKKIEETKKRTGDITGLKKRNEEKVQKVSGDL